MLAREQYVKNHSPPTSTYLQPPRKDMNEIISKGSDGLLPSLFFWDLHLMLFVTSSYFARSCFNSAILESYDGSRQLSLLYHILSLHFCFLFFFPSSFPFRAEGVNGRWSACRPSRLFISADRHHRVCSTAVCVCSQWL